MRHPEIVDVPLRRWRREQIQEQRRSNSTNSKSISSNINTADLSSLSSELSFANLHDGDESGSEGEGPLIAQLAANDPVRIGILKVDVVDFFINPCLCVCGMIVGDVCACSVVSRAKLLHRRGRPQPWMVRGGACAFCLLLFRRHRADLIFPMSDLLSR